jgi:hypothetical protein
MLEEKARQEKTTFNEVFNDGFEDARRDAQSAAYETRDEKVNGDRATLEVNDRKDGQSVTLNFVKEGGWKLDFTEGEAGDDHSGGH